VRGGIGIGKLSGNADGTHAMIGGDPIEGGVIVPATNPTGLTGLQIGNGGEDHHESGVSVALVPIV